MITTKITITTELAERIGAMAEQYKDRSCEIAYDDRRGEQLWQVTFEGWGEDGKPEHHRFIVNDETGEAVADTSLEGLGVRLAPSERARPSKYAAGSPVTHPDQPYVLGH